MVWDEASAMNFSSHSCSLHAVFVCDVDSLDQQLIIYFGIHTGHFSMSVCSDQLSSAQSALQYWEDMAGFLWGDAPVCEHGSVVPNNVFPTLCDATSKFSQ